METHAGSERPARDSLYSTWGGATILQFPVGALSRATWNCSPAKPSVASSAHLLPFHYCFYFFLSSFLFFHSHSTPPPGCDIMLGILKNLYPNITHSDNQSVISQSVTGLPTKTPGKLYFKFHDRPVHKWLTCGIERRRRRIGRQPSCLPSPFLQHSFQNSCWKAKSACLRSCGALQANTTIDISGNKMVQTSKF